MKIVVGIASAVTGKKTKNHVEAYANTKDYDVAVTKVGDLIVLL